MTPALMVLNPRKIPECVGAIDALTIPKVWFSNMTEAHLAPYLNVVVEFSGYDPLVIVSDDTAPTQQALDCVLALHGAGHPVVTGFCNLDSVMAEVNLSRLPLPSPPPTEASYDFLTRAEVDGYGDGLVPTTFAGFALTCMSQSMWLKYPYAVTQLGAQTDYSLSWRLQCDAVPIVSHRDAFVHHLKDVWNTPDRSQAKRMYIGECPPEIRWS